MTTLWALFTALSSCDMSNGVIGFNQGKAVE